MWSYSLTSGPSAEFVMEDTVQKQADDQTLTGTRKLTITPNVSLIIYLSIYVYVCIYVKIYIKSIKHVKYNIIVTKCYALICRCQSLIFVIKYL